MIIIETCQKCGNDIQDEIICTNPPIPRKTCWNCGWSWEGEREEVILVPFGGYVNKEPFDVNKLEVNLDELTLLNNYNFDNATVGTFQQTACINCTSNPKNYIERMF